MSAFWSNTLNFDVDSNNHRDVHHVCLMCEIWANLQNVSPCKSSRLILTKAISQMYIPEIPDFLNAPCNGVISHGAQFRGLRVFANHTWKSKRKTNAFMIFPRCAAFYACLPSRSYCNTSWYRTHLQTKIILITGKPEDPQGQDGAGSGISGVYL